MSGREAEKETHRRTSRFLDGSVGSMSNLPSGAITYLFTDLEGSTRLWESHPERMRLALLRHDALVHEAVERHQGTVVRDRGEGDSFFAVFERPPDAISAACELQRWLRAEPWPPETPVRVRIALHTGIADLRDGSYYGVVVNRCARLRAAAHGGQTLVSEVTASLARGHLPAGVSLRGLGVHRLKDLQSPEPIYQLEHPDLDADFPPLLTLDGHSQNLPVQTTSLVGREREVEEVTRLLGETRLLTITGAGGCGKTRLMLQAASEALGDFADGVWLVELAALADPALIPQTIAAALRVPEAPGWDLTECLIDHLRPRESLLLLDNCEHVLDAGARLVVRLLESCAGLRILTTSREVLRVPGEVSYETPPLGLPEARAEHRPEDPGTLLSRYDATRLFLERALAVSPTFSPSRAQAAFIIQICRRLDGIPLAIELAAPWVRALSVEQIAARLDDCFRLLTRGRRTDLPRQQTLQALVDWSHDLLSIPERALLRRVSVFAGGWTLEAAEEIASDAETPGRIADEDLVELLYRLIEKSLVIVKEARDGELRYRLLESVRQYGRAKLAAADEAAAVQARHRDFFLQLAEVAAGNLNGPEQSRWLSQLEDERDNLRAALARSREDPDSAEVTVRLATALWRFWYKCGYRSEWFDWLGKAIRLPGILPATRVRALSGAGILAWAYGDYDASRGYHQECLERRRAMGDLRGVAGSSNNLGLVAVSSGQLDVAREHFEQSLATYRELGDEVSGVAAQSNLGSVLMQQGDYQAAQQLHNESLLTYRRLEDAGGEATALHNLAWGALHLKDFAAASRLAHESLELRQKLGDRRGVLSCIHLFADLAADSGRHLRAVILFASWTASAATLDVPPEEVSLRKWRGRLEDLSRVLGDAEVERLREAGEALTLEEGGKFALGDADEVYIRNSI